MTRILAVSVEEAGDALGISRSLAYKMAREGKIPTIRMGNRLIVPLSKLEEMLNGA